MVLPLLTELCASAVVASSATLSETRISVSTTTLHVLNLTTASPTYIPGVGTGAVWMGVGRFSLRLA